MFYVYIMTSPGRTVLYTGVTSELETRIAKHRLKQDPHSFTARYNATVLVYFEEAGDAESAITREKQIKGGSRRDKIALIESKNPFWRDLAPETQGGA